VTQAETGVIPPGDCSGGGPSSVVTGDWTEPRLWRGNPNPREWRWRRTRGQLMRGLPTPRILSRGLLSACPLARRHVCLPARMFFACPSDFEMACSLRLAQHQPGPVTVEPRRQPAMADPLAFLYYRPPECQWPGLWDRLPQELLDKVSELMDTETRLALALTSRWMHWRLKMTLWRSVRLQGKGATFSPNLDHFIERATVAQRLLYVEKPFTSYIRQATIQPSEQRIILDGRWSHSIVPPPNMPLDDLPVQIFRAVSYMTNVRYLDIWLPHLEPHSPSLSAHLNGYSSEVQTWDSVRFLRLRVKDPDLERFILERLVYNLEGLHIEKTVSELDRSYFLLHPQLQRLYCNLDEWLMLYDDDYDPTIEPSQIPRLNELFPDLKWLVLGESTGPSPPGENFEKDEYVRPIAS